MFSKRDLKNHLQEISEDAVFVKFQFFSTDKFSVQLKCKTAPEQSSEHSTHVGEWVRKFSSFTATTWIVRNSFPNRKRMVFRKVFACHRSSFNKKTKLNPDQTRNQGCRAKIDFRIKFINKNTVKNDPLLKQGLNLTISIDFIHSHKLWTAEAFTLLKSTSETDEMFYSYLNNGYSPTAAKLYHELALIDRYDSPECLMNANINPTVRHVHYLHKKFKKNNEENPNFEDIMAAKRSAIENSGGFISYDNPEVIVVVTSTMRRVISSTCMDHILVDGALVNGSVVTFLYVPSKAGALPLACVLHAEQNETSFTQAFLAVKLALDSTCNGFDPKLITVKESKEIRDAANAIFPNSNVRTSKWSLCSDVWQWIFGEDIKIESKKRHNIMELFHRLIRANTLSEADICYTQLKQEDCVKSLPIVNDYVDALWGKRDQWLHGDEQNYMKIVEVSIRLMDEFIQSKCKSFNVYVMMDVVTNIIENQIRHMLCAHVNSSNIAATYTRFLCKSKPSNTDPDLKQISANEFRLESSVKPKKYVRFRTDTWCCDCAVGRKGRFCEHLCAIVNTVDTDLLRPCELTDEEKCLLTEIAGGDVEEAKTIKCELSDNKMDVEESDNDEIDNDYSLDEPDNALDNDEVDKQSVTSLKSENKDDDGFFYLDVKAENYVSVDPLEEPCDLENKTEELSNITADNYDIPNTSSVSKMNFKNKYEETMKGLNDEFRRLNRHFKQNPNRGNLETMVRLARELSKIRPVERVDFSNMQITLNSRDSETES